MAKTQDAKLIVSLLDRLSGPAKAISGTLSRLYAMQARNTAALDQMRGRMLDAMGAGYALARSLSAPINAAIAFESTMADVSKVVDFESPKAFAQMGKDIRELSLRIPMAADGLGQIVAAAGQSGIANNELLKFTELAAKVGVAWDMSADQTGEALAKLKTALGRSIEDTASLADAINHLGNNSAASAPKILDVVRRVAPMASQFGMTAEEVAALGAAMTGAGFESEVASTSILNIGRALTRGSGATARQSKAFKTLGLSSKAVAKSMQNDAMGTLQGVLERIGRLPADMRASLVSDLFGDEARALGPLISNGKLLGDTLDLIGDKSQYAGSAAKEFDVRSKTSANNMQLFRNRVTDLAISVGDALLPALNKVMDVLGPTVTSISDLAQRFPALTAGIVGATAAVIAFRIALTALRFAGLYALGGMISTAIGFTTFAGAATAVGAALAAISAPVWLAIGAAVAVVAGAGALLYKYWDRITATLRGVAAGISEELAPAFETLRPVLASIEAGFRAIGDAGSWVMDKLSGLTGLFDKEIVTFQHGQAIEAGAKAMTQRIIRVFIDGHAQIFAAGSQMVQALWDGMVAKFDAFIAWVKTIPSRIRSAIGNIDLSGMIRLPSFLGGGGDSPQVDGARAAGGPVSAGKTYLVGERGPELFSPSNAGVITPNHALRASSAANSNVPPIQVTNHFQIIGAGNAEAVAQAVVDRQARTTKSAVEAAYMDAA
ncbi:phage tail tape measure protein [Allorhizobium sp. NPDC080224]|uniref:phage tail tape measure protein n=1 Tax=Allorhizobium sp. NPDC080224 TaxID=3390547 RepID=UPI003CFFB2DA